MPRNVAYAVFDKDTGLLVRGVSVPADFPQAEPIEGALIVYLADGVLPRSEVKVDRRKIKKPVTEVATLSDAILPWAPPPLPDEALLAMNRDTAISALDASYAEQIAGIAGPLAMLHAEKRRQAEAGGGPLVADEADKLAILANAQVQDEAIAALEQERRAAKQAIREATTTEEVAAALQAASGPVAI